MRIIAAFIVVILAITTWLITNEVFAICDINSQASAGTFLKGCSDDGNNSISLGQGNDATNIKKLVISISKQVIGFGALFAIGAIVFSGIQYTTSYGDDEKVKKAKTTGVYAIIGLLLLLLAFPLVDIMVNFVYGLGA
jgi:hypothetical protein